MSASLHQYRYHSYLESALGRHLSIFVVAWCSSWCSLTSWESTWLQWQMVLASSRWSLTPSNQGFWGGFRLGRNTCDRKKGFSMFTIPETNIAPEPRLFPNRSSLPTINFQVLCLLVSGKNPCEFVPSSNSPNIKDRVLQWNEVSNSTDQDVYDSRLQSGC